MGRKLPVWVAPTGVKITVVLTTIASRASGGTRTCVITDRAHLNALRPAWDELAGDTGAPTRRHAWAAACARAFQPADGLRVLVVLRDRRLVAVAALGRGEDGEGLEPLGVAELGTPAPFVYADEEALRTLAQALAALDQPVTMRRVPTESPALSAIAGAYAPRGFVACTPAPRDHDHMLADMASSERDLQWARARAQELGDVAFERVCPGPDEVDDVLALALGVEPPDPRWVAFLRHYAPTAAAEGTLRTAFLRLDGVPVATQIGVEHGGRVWLLRSGRLEAHASWSPETLLLRECVRASAARGLEEIRCVRGPWPRGDGPPASVCLRAHPSRGRRLAALARA
jgi:hypothetical protein